MVAHVLKIKKREETARESRRAYSRWKKRGDRVNKGKNKQKQMKTNITKTKGRSTLISAIDKDF